MASSFYPVVANRVSDVQQRYRNIYQLQSDSSSIAKLQVQLSTGKRFTRPSEDPTAAIRVMGIQKETEFKIQAKINLKSSEAFLNTTEASLSDTQNLLNDARGIAVQANTTLNSRSERDGLVSQIDAIIERMVNIANSRYQNRFLMSGGLVAQQPISFDGTSVVFKGNDAELLSLADEGEFLASNVTAQRALGVVSTAAVSTLDLNPQVSSNTRLAELNGGLGVSPGAIGFSDGNNQATVDLAGAETVGDVIERINLAKVGNRSIQATLSTTGININYADSAGGTLRISDIGVGSTASDLGIATTVAAPSLPIQGKDLDPLLRRTTLVSSLNLGGGINLTGGVELRFGDKTYRAELANANSIQDILNAFQKSGAPVSANISADGRSLEVKSLQSGANFTIGESQGGLASRLGLRTFTAETQLSQLNYGRGVSNGVGSDLQIVNNAGAVIDIDLQGAITVQDVLNKINSHVANQDPLTRVSAAVTDSGKGITLSSQNGTQPFQVKVVGGSEAAWDLGIVPKGQTEISATVSGASQSLAGADPNPQEVKGVFNTLIRLRNAISNGDNPAIDRAILLLDEDRDRVSLSRGDLGVRLQRIDRMIQSNEDEQVILASQQSDAMDVDFAQAISDLTARQTALQASLSLIGQSSQLSLFNFL